MSRPPKSRQSAYQRHGLYTLKGALSAVETRRGGGDVLGGLGDAGRALLEWRAAIVADLGGEDSISAQERAVIDAATTTYLLLSSVDHFLLNQESIVNKSRRKLFPVVLERQRLADALVRYLETLGLRRRIQEAPDLGHYLTQRYGGRPVGATAGVDGAPPEPASDTAPEAASQKGEATG